MKSYLEDLEYRKGKAIWDYFFMTEAQKVELRLQRAFILAKILEIKKNGK